MKLLVGLNNKNILDYLDYTNSFIIGLKDFSINYLEYSLDEIKKLREDYPSLELFVSINKNIFNSDLDNLESILIMLDKLNINGILFYDLAVLSLWQKNHLQVPPIWAQEHMTTNYNTCNYYYNKGCEYAYLSNEITVDEIKEIKEKSRIKLISFIFGYPDVSFSKRKLLTNYFLHHNKKKDNDWYTIKSDNDSDNKYFIKENDLGTRILYGNILNGIKPLFDLKDTLDYAIASEDLIDHDTFIKCLQVFKDFMDNKTSFLESLQKVEKLTGSSDTVFYYKRTIYKVRDEKD